MKKSEANVPFFLLSLITLLLSIHHLISHTCNLQVALLALLTSRGGHGTGVRGGGRQSGGMVRGSALVGGVVHHLRAAVTKDTWRAKIQCHLAYS